MKTKETVILCVLFFVIIASVFGYNTYFKINQSFAKEENAISNENVEISKADKINIDEIIEKNTNNGQYEQLTTKEEKIEYLTEYKINKKIPKGVSYVIQEGREGIQKIVIKSSFNKENAIISEEQVESSIVKAPSNKIIEIGGADYTQNYNVKKGDTVYVTSDQVSFMLEPDEESTKITTIKQNTELKVLEILQSWYKVTYQNRTGWIKSECTTYRNFNENTNKSEGQANQKNKQQLLSELDFNMNLNKPSGLSLEQFKKVLDDSKDLNKVFKNNAEYFYYVEKQYNINGIFVAAIGIHESAWGTSKIAEEKNNLFGYGAYDSSPYNSAYNFDSYSESIDLIARVLVKYYLNTNGTNIYSGEKATGAYYNGPNLAGVNVKYATDKNWSKKVYENMKYLYNKL